MRVSFKDLNKIERVNPPDGLYNKIMESVNNRANVKLIYASVACIVLLITINIFSYKNYNESRSISFNNDYLNIPINNLSYE